MQLCLFVCVFSIVNISCQPFIEKQVILASGQTDSLITISGNSEIFVVTSLIDPFTLFFNNGREFEKFQDWKIFDQEVAVFYQHIKPKAIDVTDDGLFGIAGGVLQETNIGTIVIVDYVPQHNKFDKLVTIPNDSD